MNTKLGASEDVAISARMRSALVEGMRMHRAAGLISHKRPYDRDDKTGLFLYRRVDEDELVFNVITNVGAIQIHKGAYATSGLPTNGFNYIALSNDAVAETATSTTLSTEIAANGLSRAQGTVTLPTTSGRITTIDHTFTCATGAQAAQKSALFDASSAGNMNHVLAFTQRSLQIADTLDITYSCTIS